MKGKYLHLSYSILVQPSIETAMAKANGMWPHLIMRLKSWCMIPLMITWVLVKCSTLRRSSLHNTSPTSWTSNEHSFQARRPFSVFSFYYTDCAVSQHATRHCMCLICWSDKQFHQRYLFRPRSRLLDHTYCWIPTLNSHISWTLVHSCVYKNHVIIRVWRLSPHL